MRRFWTAQELDQVRAMYPNRPTSAVAAAVRRSVYSVYQAAYAMGLHKTREFLSGPESGWLVKGSQVGRATRYKKGHVPANKGIRRPGWSAGRMRETQFQKGCRTGVAARNWKPIGTILPDPEGYLRIKVREAVYGKEATGFGNVKIWPLLQRHVWEQANGPIPKGHVICFKNGDKGNCAIENLECISRADLARRNAMWGRYPAELTAAILANGALKRKLRRLGDGEK